MSREQALLNLVNDVLDAMTMEMRASLPTDWEARAVAVLSSAGATTKEQP